MVECNFNTVTLKLIRMVVYGTWLLIEPCGAHRFSVGAAGLITIIATIISFALPFTNSVSDDSFGTIAGLVTLMNLFV